MINNYFVALVHKCNHFYCYFIQTNKYKLSKMFYLQFCFYCIEISYIQGLVFSFWFYGMQVAIYGKLCNNSLLLENELPFNTTYYYSQVNRLQIPSIDCTR